MTAYYNEFDPFAAAWLRELIKNGRIAAGDVDERSIADVRPEDLRGYTQVHFFAGIGGWSYALRLAGWPDDVPVWTGSCPCQPFSAAGKKKGTADHRHLWPEMHRLIGQCRPTVAIGEQVASKDGRKWFTGVRADLEALGYGVGCADLCAASVGAPHIRQRLFWVADTGHYAGPARSSGGQHESGTPVREFPGSDSKRPLWLADTEHAKRRSEHEVNADAYGRHRPGWSGAVGIPCRDGKTRRVAPGVPLLAHGIPGRVAQLRGLGNAICPQVAAEFVQAYIEARSGKFRGFE